MQLIGKAVTESHAIVTVHQRSEQMEGDVMWPERFSASVNLGKVGSGDGKIDDCLHIGLDNAEEMKKPHNDVGLNSISSNIIN